MKTEINKTICLSVCLFLPVCLPVCLSVCLSRKHGGGPLWSHNRILSVWSECLNNLQIHHKKEPRNRYTETDDRPDIVVFDTDNGKNIDLDISLAHPWSNDVIKLAAREQCFAAKRREDKEN